MQSLRAPVDASNQPILAGVVFEKCVSMVKKSELQARLRAVRLEIESESVDYDAKAKAGALYQKKSHDHVGAVSSEEMVKVYTQRMVPADSAGRAFYNQIMLLPDLRRCPFCGIGVVSTLDHFLPKKKFPVFSVTPNNLVPACSWCQDEKLEYYGRSEGDQLLHPYFDNVDSEVWLSAEALVSVPAVFRYFAAPPENWPVALKGRLAAHIEQFNLAVLYQSNAGSRLAEIRGFLAVLHQRGGAGAVRGHLEEQVFSMELDRKNSWVAAMYRAAAVSSWFCDGGFLGK